MRTKGQTKKSVSAVVFTNLSIYLSSYLSIGLLTRFASGSGPRKGHGRGSRSPWFSKHGGGEESAVLALFIVTFHPSNSVSCQCPSTPHHQPRERERREKRSGGEGRGTEMERHHRCCHQSFSEPVKQSVSQSVRK